MNYEELTQEQKDALCEAFEDCGVYTEEENIAEYYNKYPEIASLNIDSNGREFAWVIWGENRDGARYVDSLDYVPEEEIEKICAV